MAKERAADAIAERLGAICVAQFNGDSAKSEKVKEMKGKDSWDNGRYIEKQSWAIMPGDEKPDSKVADACAKRLAEKANNSLKGFGGVQEIGASSSKTKPKHLPKSTRGKRKI